MGKKLFLAALLFIETAAFAGVDNAFYRRGAIASESPALKQIGRFDSGDGLLQFSWSGSTVVARFQGTSATIHLRHLRMNPAQPIYYSYIVDGGPRQVFSVAGDTVAVTLAAGLRPGIHDVWVERESEGFLGISQLLGFDFGRDGKLLPPFAASPKRIEIIGDSIATGYGDNDSNPGCHFSSKTQSAFLAFGATAARALEMDATLVAYSGKGVHNNYDTTDYDPRRPTMPHDFLYTLTPTNYVGSDSDEGKFLYDFRDPADVVVINLGTNDFHSKILTSETFIESYVGFVRVVRQKYPRAKIFAVVGSTLQKNELSILQDAVAKVVFRLHEAGDTDIFYANITPETDRWLGCDNHPSAEQQQAMADLLVKAIRAEF